MPDDLKKVLEGSRVAILSPKSTTPLAGGRACSNCYWNPSGKVCQLEPLRSQYLPVGPGQLGLKDTPAVVPPDYVCSHHDYEIEVPENRRRNVTALQLKSAKEASDLGLE
jgi:hypothetical protein